MLKQNWVTIKKLSSIFGYSEDAIRAKKKKGVWLENIHWIKAPDNRIFFSLVEIEAWLQQGA